MFQKGHFPKNTSKEDIVKAMEKESFQPKLITEPPHHVYKPHQHPETKLIVCLEGSMKVTVEDKKFQFEPGDKLLIPGNTTHSGLVGDKGCVYYWSEKLITPKE